MYNSRILGEEPLPGDLDHCPFEDIDYIVVNSLFLVALIVCGVIILSSNSVVKFVVILYI